MSSDSGSAQPKINNARQRPTLQESSSYRCKFPTTAKTNFGTGSEKTSGWKIIYNHRTAIERLFSRGPHPRSPAHEISPGSPSSSPRYSLSGHGAQLCGEKPAADNGR